MSTYREPYDRLRGEFKPRHLRNLCEYLTPRHRDGMKFSAVEPNLADSSNIAALATFLEENFDRDAINRASKVLSDEYARNVKRGVATKEDKPTRRGRPLGSKNKQQIDATADLEANPSFKERQEAARKLIDSDQRMSDPHRKPLTSEQLEDAASELQKSVDDHYERTGQTRFEEKQTMSSEALTRILEAYALKSQLLTVAENIMAALKSKYEGLENEFAKLQDKVAALKELRPTIIELRKPDMPPISGGTQHRNFPLLVTAANARMRSNNHLNVWLHGPAGTGKTAAAEKLAELFDLKFRYNGALMSAFQLLGYNDANGKYVRTPFRDSWEKGGVYLFDEIDGSMPDALLAMNGALANSIASFPDGMIERHPDCIIIAAANTTGLGGGIEYVGAMKQNAAFLNRFVYIAWPHDDALESVLCANEAWLQRVRYVRAKYVQQGFKGHLITMRASIFGEALLNAGMAQDDVEAATLKQGLTDAQWRQIGN